MIGDCTPETYVHALRIGCRAVECKTKFVLRRGFFNRLILVDCYDGDQMEPVVYHARTLTRPIRFRAIIHAMKSHAFAVSP